MEEKLNIEQMNQIQIMNELKNIKEILKDTQEKPQICILWDMENVNPGVKSLFVDGLIEYVCQYGRITISKAFGDWTNPAINKMVSVLSAKSFELIHTHSPIKRKNVSDIEMITNGIETALQNPKLSVFFLVTGDSDFRPLINSLKRTGKEVYIIYDNKRVSEELLSTVDDYIDYRQLIPGEEVDEESIGERSVEERIKESMDLLVECVAMMEKDKSRTYLSTVKVKMKMLNPSFDEQELGFSQWSKFVERAVSEGVIKVEEDKGKTQIYSAIQVQESSIPCQDLLDVLTELDGARGPNFWLFSVVSARLKQTGFDYKSHGYNQFKKYLLDLETRNLVETKAEGLNHSVRRITK